MKNVISWDVVHAIHKTVAGIYVTEGIAQSLLVNTAKGALYPNSVKPKEIIYCLGSDTQPHGIRALLDSVAKKKKIHVFQKLGVNEWVDLKMWVPFEMREEENGFWPIRLMPE